MRRKPSQTVYSADGVAVGFVSAPTDADAAMLADIVRRYAQSVADGTDHVPRAVWRVSDRH